ncbi:MAG: hypothetical protein J0I48_15555 [Devosia sp.]|mgnify:CR=1 FL=1|uniref:hypothetical protein n=1 Tax=Devosia sp. 66-22 TaxID=1895753 RepID=UPI00092617AB|nr:hypothetical protein [Devosia sp. 66-22]MBN9347587.1 hypothetical protein [Devosia sp.]OJX54730.1 MAG: hypothetical protein BGO81_16555 [Devosia sp. 66-22]
MLTVRPTVLRDIARLEYCLRAEDVAEVEAGGLDPYDALFQGYCGDVCLTAVDEEQWPVVMFGVSPHPAGPEVGCVWALGSDAIKKHRVDFLRQSPRWVREFHKSYPLLTNHTDCRNTEHHRWLRWCGFSFVQREVINGLPFYEFVRIRKDDDV